jgi:hypothetical protein
VPSSSATSSSSDIEAEPREAGTSTDADDVIDLSAVGAGEGLPFPDKWTDLLAFLHSNFVSGSILPVDEEGEVDEKQSNGAWN